MQGMRDFMRTTLGRSLRTLTVEDRLATALPVVCGAALAAHCEVGRLDEEGTLHVRVRDREWLPSLLSMREVLQRDLARTAGVVLGGLHFEVAGMGPGSQTKVPLRGAAPSKQVAADRPRSAGSQPKRGMDV